MKNRRHSHVGVFVCAKVRGRERRRDREGEREGRRAQNDTVYGVSNIYKLKLKCMKQ